MSAVHAVDDEVRPNLRRCTEAVDLEAALQDVDTKKRLRIEVDVSELDETVVADARRTIALQVEVLAELAEAVMDRVDFAVTVSERLLGTDAATSPAITAVIAQRAAALTEAADLAMVLAERAVAVATGTTTAAVTTFCSETDAVIVLADGTEVGANDLLVTEVLDDDALSLLRDTSL